MARGFESKSVADQQESAEQERGRRGSSSAPPVSARQRQLELARCDLVARLQGPGSDAYHQTLQRALDALDEELARLR